MKAPAKTAATGRPLLVGERLKTTSFRLTVAQQDKLAKLGGGEWIRKKIDAANVK